jgi:uncharacterized protein YecT (DUF1311 family)
MVATAAVLAATAVPAFSAHAPADAFARCQKRAMTTQDIEKCQTAELKRLGKRLTAALAKERSALGSGARLDRAQARWRRFRASYCDYLFHVHSQGTIGPVIAGDCQIRLTRERLHDVTVDARGLGG